MDGQTVHIACGCKDRDEAVQRAIDNGCEINLDDGE